MESFLEVWSAIGDYCKTKMTEVAYNVWIEPLKPISLENGVAVLFVQSVFQRNIILDKYVGILSEAFENTLGFGVEITIYTAEDTDHNGSAIYSGLGSDGSEQKKEEYEYTFDSFIVGSSNKFAHAAAQAVATNPAGAYNPLFIYGNSGLGKTHLLNAITYEINNDKPELNIIYTRGEDFTNELIDLIAAKNTSEFHNKYRNADVLMVDDVQFIAGKTQTQEEFFHTFNSLYQAGKQIVLTSDRPPKEINTLEDRLRTRFEWGLLADIQPPDFETRMAIIKRKAERLDLDIPDDVIQYIAERLKTNIRQLEGAVKKLKAYNSLEGHTPSIMIAQNAIRDILNDDQPIPVTVEKIISEVSRIFGISAEDIRSTKRSANISKARQIAMYVVREVTGMSMENIGSEFGGRDHSTVVYALNQVEKTMQKDSQTKGAVNDIIKNIQEK